MAVVGLMSMVTPIGFIIGFVYPVIFAPDSTKPVNTLRKEIYSSIVVEVILTGVFLLLVVVSFFERPLEEIEDQNTE